MYIEIVNANPARSALLLFPETNSAVIDINNTAIAQELIESTSAAPITVRIDKEDTEEDSLKVGQGAPACLSCISFSPISISLSPIKNSSAIKTTGMPRFLLEIL